MKTRSARTFILTLFLLSIAFFAIGSLHAQTNSSAATAVTAPAATSIADPSAPTWLPDPNLVIGLVRQYLPANVANVVLTICLVIGALRFVVKPAVAAFHFVAEQTDTPKDNELIAKIESSTWLKWLYFGLDWFASIKIRK